MSCLLHVLVVELLKVRFTITFTHNRFSAHHKKLFASSFFILGVKFNADIWEIIFELKSGIIASSLNSIKLDFYKSAPNIKLKKMCDVWSISTNDMNHHHTKLIVSSLLKRDCHNRHTYHKAVSATRVKNVKHIFNFSLSFASEVQRIEYTLLWFN